MAAAGGRVIALQTLDLSQGGLDTLVPQYTLHAAWDQVAGFVVVVNAVDRTYLEALREAGKPVVLLSEEMAGFSCPVVRPDNRSGVLQAVAHLVQHGHRRIAFVGSLFQPDTRERLDAYREALTDHGIAPDDSLLFETSDNLEGSGEAAGRAMLAAGLPSTAVVAATDFNALGVMKALGDAGLSLPDDQAIVGFDDVEAASSVRPTLSSVRQSFRATGRLAASLLLEMVDGTRGGSRAAPGAHLVRAPRVLRLRAGSAVEVIAELDPASLPTPRDRLRFRLQRLLFGGEPLPPEELATLDQAVELIAGCVGPGCGATEPAHDACRRAARRALLAEPALDHDHGLRRLPATLLPGGARRRPRGRRPLSRRASPRSCSSSPGRWPSASRRPTPPSTFRCAGSTSSAWG